MTTRLAARHESRGAVAVGKWATSRSPAEGLEGGGRREEDMMEQAGRARSWVGRDLVDQDGATIGRVDDVFLDEQTGAANWAAVRMKARGDETAFLPLRGAIDEGMRLRVPVARDRALAAPRTETPEGRLTPEQEEMLLAHYQAPSDRDAPRTSATDGVRDLPSFVRSEEELRVDKRVVPRERVRLVKRVVTETVTKTVDLRREELHVERLPGTAMEHEGTGQASDQPVPATPGPLAKLADRLPQPLVTRLASLRRPIGLPQQLLARREPFAEEVTDVVLMQEELVITKRAVPRERIRLRTETVTEQRRITDDLRRERVELEHLPPAGE